MQKIPFLSIVIPIYNEEQNLHLLTEELLNVLSGIKQTWEIIFVDDGSTDCSLKILEELSLKWAHIRISVLGKNMGQSAAFAAGFAEAKGDIIVTMDGDLQNDPKDIPDLIEMAKEYDLVCGWRQKRNDNVIRRVSSRIANGIRNIFLDDGIRDVGCSLKVFRKKYLMKLKLYDGMHRFFPALIKMEGGRIAEVPVNHRARRYGQAKYNIGNRIFKSFVDLLAVSWMKKRHFPLAIKEYF